METVKVICQNTSSVIEVEAGTSLLELERKLGIEGKYPFLAAYVNNRIKELNYKIFKPLAVRFIDITHFEGYRVYQRTISFIVHKINARLKRCGIGHIYLCSTLYGYVQPYYQPEHTEHTVVIPHMDGHTLYQYSDKSAERSGVHQLHGLDTGVAFTSELCRYRRIECEIALCRKHYDRKHGPNAYYGQGGTK